MPGSGIREIVNLAVTMPDVIRLEVGEPNFATPDHIVAGALKGIEDGFTKYTQSSGLLSLRELIADKVRRINGYEITPHQVNVGVGAVQVITSLLFALIESGDEVLLPDPGWPNYEMSVLLCGGRPVRYPLHIADGFVPQVAELERLVTGRTKLLIINSPSNPTGAVFSRDTITHLVDFAQRHDLYLLADEVYEQLIFEGEHYSPALLDPERTIGAYSFSKAYAMTGWRVGYTVSNPELARLVMKIQEPMISCVSSVSQKAAEAALTGPQDCIAEMRASYQARRDAVVEVLQRRGRYVYTPRGAFYIMIDVSASGMASRDFALHLLQESRVAVAPGTAFGTAGANFVRVSLATAQDQLVRGVERLCDTIDECAAARP